MGSLFCCYIIYKSWEIFLYPHSPTWASWTHSHRKNTYSPAKGSPERAVVHTVFTAPFNYWLVVFLVLWEAAPYEQGERPTHKNCSRTLSLKPVCSLLTSASLLNGTFTYLAQFCSLGCLLFPSLSLICLIYSYILLPFIYLFPPQNLWSPFCSRTQCPAHSSLTG